jgi:putative hemolysin
MNSPVARRSAEDSLHELVSLPGFRMKVEMVREDSIPESGPFIIVSNFPFGGIEELLLARAIHPLRSDLLIPNGYLHTGPHAPQGIQVTWPGGDKVDTTLAGIGDPAFIQGLTRDGIPVGLFPAGKAATFRWRDLSLHERRWPLAVIKTIMKARVPVIPVFFDAGRIRFYPFFSLVNQEMRNRLLHAELSRLSGSNLTVRIGRPVSVKEQKRIHEARDFGRYLRMRTLSLGVPAIGGQSPITTTPGTALPQVAGPPPAEKILEEIKKSGAVYSLFSFQEYEVFCAPTTEIPAIMQELGRLRELTYRAVGEGTGHPTDMDEFDPHYHQLFIWNDIEKEIIGGYRVGFGHDIMKTLGIRGFYISTLFRISPRFIPVLQNSMELGRSFIIKAYQRKPLSLFLLWKGILMLLYRHPEFRYLIGPVSISKDISEFARSLTVEFLQKHHYNMELAAAITPRNRFRPRIPRLIRKKLFHRITGNNIANLDHFIQGFDPGFSTPVLIKKYLGINSEVIGFNIDPHFNNCLDALIITDINDIPEEIIRSLSKESNPTPTGSHHPDGVQINDKQQ